MTRTPFLIYAIQALFIILVAFVACQPKVTEAPALTQAPGPRLRITNTGSETIKGLVVIFPGERINFGDVPGGVTTNYLAAPEGVYQYAAYEYLLNGAKITQPVIEWVGETPLMDGGFTYALTYHPDQVNGMRIELVKVEKE